MLKIDEKHLEDIIFNQLATTKGMENLKQRGLPVFVTSHFNLFRQFKLGEYGIPDIVRIIYNNGFVNISIIELKVTDFHPDHLFQLCRYMAGVRNIIQEGLNISPNKVDVNGYLITTDFKPNGAHWLAEQMHSVDIYTTEYRIDGLWFTSALSSRWKKTNMDHSAENYISLQDCKKQYRKSYKEFLNTRKTQPF